MFPELFRAKKNFVKFTTVHVAWTKSEWKTYGTFAVWVVMASVGVARAQVDGVSLEGLGNEEAVDVLRRTGQVTRLKLARHHYGSKYEQLLHAAAIGQFFSSCSLIYLCI